MNSLNILSTKKLEQKILLNFLIPTPNSKFYLAYKRSKTIFAAIPTL